MSPELNLRQSKRQTMVRWLIGAAVCVIGALVNVWAVQYASKILAELPSIPDPVLSRIPYRDLFFVGEIIFWLLLVSLVTLLFVTRRSQVPYVLLLVGVFYALRAAFQVLLPLGHPIDAPAFDSRFSLYPFPNAYFPSGHIGLLSMLTMFLPTKKFRWLFAMAVILFACGTMLTRAHYAVDALGAIVIVYAVHAFGEKHIRQWFARVGQ